MACNGVLVYCNWNSGDLDWKLQKVIKHTSGVSYPRDEEIIREATKEMDEYFRGEREIFQVPFELYGTEFQKKVWTELGRVTYGTTLSYKEISIQCGLMKGMRAVASACGANPLAIIIPCHRIVGADGSIGGYTGGVDKKNKLLEHEFLHEIQKKFGG